MNKWWWLLLIIVCWLAAGYAIFELKGSDTFSEGTLQVSQPARIVSMAPNLTEILFALGLDEEIVAVSRQSDYPPEAVTKPRIGTFWQPNVEAVIAARPDLVVTLGFDRQKSLAQRLKRIGYKSLILNIEKINDLFEAIDKIGAAVAKEHQARELVSGIGKKLDNLSALIGSREKVKVLWVVQREPLRVAGRGTFVNEMIELAGGQNAIDSTVHKYPPIGSEQVYACGAEVIIEPAMTNKDLRSQQESAEKYWSRFKILPAVKNERIYVIDGDMVSRLGPRLYEAVETIARCLRPALFKN